MDPLPRTRKRLAAPLLVFILGMVALLVSVQQVAEPFRASGPAVTLSLRLLNAFSWGRGSSPSGALPAWATARPGPLPSGPPRRASGEPCRVPGAPSHG